MNRDEDHLRLLAVFHYVVAGLMALFACIPIIHLVMGLAIMSGGFLTGPGNSAPNSQPPAWLGVFFAVLGGLAVILGWSLAIAIAFAGRFLTQRRRYMYCLVVAAISCMFFPFGTVLGVFTIIVLMRPAVKGMFGLSPEN